mgnify:CR=1 FL=1
MYVISCIILFSIVFVTTAAEAEIELQIKIDNKTIEIKLENFLVNLIFVFLLYFFKSKKFVPQNKSSASVPEGRVRFSRGTTLFHSPKRAECIREIAFTNSNSPRLPQKDFIGSDAAATTHLPRSKPAFVREWTRRVPTDIAQISDLESKTSPLRLRSELYEL